MIKVLINGTICPTVENDTILVNKKIADVQNPDEKKADWTQSFLIQNTSIVQALFGQIFQVNLDIQNVSATNFNPDFNPNLKAKIVVLNENMVAISGYCQLTDIIINKEKEISYQINAYAAIGNFFNDIRNLFLADIDFSDLTHAWTLANVENSWTPTLGSGYVYPMIDYGLNNAYQDWETIHFRPALFAKEILDRIFRNSGWSYSSSFLTSTRFKSLIIPWSAENLFYDSDEIDNRGFLVSTSGSTTVNSGQFYDINSNISLLPKILFNQDFGTAGLYTLYNNTTNDYNTLTRVTTISKSGKYVFTIGGSVAVENVYYVAKQAYSYVFNLVLDVNSSAKEQFELTVTWTAGATSDYLDFTLTSLPIHLTVGDIVKLSIGYGTLITRYERFHVGTNYVTYHFNSYTYFKMIAQPEIILSDSVDMNALLPNDIKQIDFIMSFTKAFNLYFEQSSDKTLTIEPHDDYFNNNVEDWTNKIDIGKDVSLIPMGILNAKRFKFTYEDDSDFMNKRYFSAYNEVYGTELIDVQNDFLTDTKEIKPIFAATPLSNIQSNDRILSDMRFIDQDGAVKQGQTKLRLLYWGGLLDCKPWNWRSYAGGTATTKTQYPYAGHLDNPYAPTFDLNFGIVKNVYYDDNIRLGTTITYTDANLYSTYWYKNINQITNKNSKVLEAMFYLTIADFVNVDFKKLYFIKDAYYRLLEVIDYNIDGTELVKCRLLKADFQSSFVTSSKKISGGTRVFESGGQVPKRKLQAEQRDGVTVRNDKGFEGTGNYINGLTAINNGGSNIIPYSASESFIFGANGVILSNPRNFIFNSDNITAKRSGAIFNGVSLEYKFELEVDRDFILGIANSTPADLIPSVDTKEYYKTNGFFVELFERSDDGPDLWANYSGTNKIQLLVNGLVAAEIAQTDWLGKPAGTMCKSTITARQEFTYPVRIQITGEVTGELNFRIVVFYNIITV